MPQMSSGHGKSSRAWKQGVLVGTSPMFFGLLFQFTELLGDLKVGRPRSLAFHKVTLEELLSLGRGAQFLDV